MNAQQLNVDNIANNLANANTTGYKMRRTQFQDLLYQNMVQPGAAAGPTDRRADRPAARPGHAPFRQRNHLHPGQLLADRQSARCRDSGQRLLPDPQPTGELAYTRDGSFQLDKNGNLVTSPTATRSSRRSPFRRTAQIDHHRRRRHRQLHAARTDRGAARRPDSARQLPESGGPEQPRRQSLYMPTDASGEPTVGAIPADRKGSAPCCRATRTIQRQRRGRVHQPDRRAARLRSQFQGGQGRRRNVSAGQQHDPMIDLLISWPAVTCMPWPAHTLRDAIWRRPLRSFQAVAPDLDLGSLPCPVRAGFFEPGELARITHLIRPIRRSASNAPSRRSTAAMVTEARFASRRWPKRKSELWPSAPFRRPLASWCFRPKALVQPSTGEDRGVERLCELRWRAISPCGRACA